MNKKAKPAASSRKMTMAQYEKSSMDKKADKRELAEVNKKRAMKRK